MASVLLLLVPGTACAFSVGLQDAGFQSGATGRQSAIAYSAISAVHGSVVRVQVTWAQIAPGGSTRPAGFNASSPADPRYQWASLDASVRLIADHHLQVLFEVLHAPSWAEGRGPRRPYLSPGAWNPNPADVAAFIHAAAIRYSGSYPDPLNRGRALPRVGYWEPWDEPNIPGYFSAPNPVAAYRTILNRAYGVLKAVNKSNVVVLGGLAPVSPVPGSTPPLDFGAQLLCLHRVGSGFSPNRKCARRAHFDVFGMHPYSFAATPTKHAYKPGDVLVGDMGELGALVQASNTYRTARPATGHQLWVTEFAWDTDPPNAQLGDSDATAARYVAYAMYEMWKTGTSLVVWSEVLDTQYADPVGLGLYRISGRPKLTLRAFAFPFVASVRNGRGSAWGRVPTSRPVRVTVERRSGGRWSTVAHVVTGPDGVFSTGFAARRNGVYRAEVAGGPRSLPYNSQPIPPRRVHAL
jgi:hypothetical protein